MQSTPLDMLFDPIRLSRIQDAELRYGAGEAFRMIELFTTLRESIWSEPAKGSPVPSVRRNLQRAHLNRLVKLAADPSPGTPEDAVTLARADLKWISRVCASGMSSARLDPMTRAHLDETKDRVDAVLDAPLVRPMPRTNTGPSM
jgi:hypothetical protein